MMPTDCQLVRKLSSCSVSDEFLAHLLLDLLDDDRKKVRTCNVENEAQTGEGEHRDRHDCENQEVGDGCRRLVAEPIAEAFDGAHQVGWSRLVDGGVADFGDRVA